MLRARAELAPGVIALATGQELGAGPPLGLLVFGLLAMPCLGGAYIGKWLGDRVLT